MSKKENKKRATAEAVTQNQVKSKSKKKRSQEEIILAHLKRCSKRGITSMDAFSKYGITRLSAKIFELRKHGHVIATVRETNSETGTSYGRYILVKENK